MGLFVSPHEEIRQPVPGERASVAVGSDDGGEDRVVFHGKSRVDSFLLRPPRDALHGSQDLRFLPLWYSTKSNSCGSQYVQS